MTESVGASVRDVRTQWAVVAGASLVSGALAAYEISPASVTPLLRSSLGTTGSGAGLIVSSMFGVAMVVSLPAGAVLDRIDSRTGIAAAVAAFLVAGTWGWAAASAGQYYALLASRVLGGVAYVVVWNAGIDIVSEAVGPDNRATAVGVFTASGPLGFGLGQAAGPAIAASVGWPAIFVAFPAIALAGLALFWPTSRGLGAVGEEGPPSAAEFGSVLRNRDVWLVGALGFLGYSLYIFVNSWAPSYLTDEIGLSLAASGLLAALFPVVGAASRVGGGVVSDRLFGGQRRPVVLASFLLTTPLLLGFTVVRSVAVLAAALLGAGVAIQLTLGLAYTYVRELVPVRVAATAVAVQTAVGLAGAFVAPIAGGAIIDASGYPVAFFLTAVLGALGVALAWRAPEPV